MHYYIYPRNWDAEDIALNLGAIDEKITFSFIDDSDLEISLESQKESIRSSDSIILIASKYRYFELAKKLETNGIQNYVDGLKFCANKINTHYKKYLQEQYGTRYSVGLLVTQLPHSEHISAIIAELQNRKIPIVFFVSSEQTYKRYSTEFNRIPVIMSRCDLISEISFVTLMHAMTHYVKIHSNVVSILNPQGLLDPVQNYFYFSRDCADSLIGSRVGFDYIFCHTKKMLEFYGAKLSHLIHRNQLVPVGYPSLDSYIQSYKDVVGNTDSSELDRKSVIVAFTVSITKNNRDVCSLDIETLKELVENLLKKYKVIFRPHPESGKKKFMLEVVEYFSKLYRKDRFVYDETPRLSSELMQEALAIVGNQTSLLQTFPYTTLKRGIIFVKERSIFKDSGLQPNDLADNVVHKLAYTVFDVLEGLEEIQRENLENVASQILQAREREIFNVGCSSEKIVDFFESVIARKKKEEAFDEVC